MARYDGRCLSLACACWSFWSVGKAHRSFRCNCWRGSCFAVELIAAKATLVAASNATAEQLQVIVILAGSVFPIGSASEAHLIPVAVRIRILRFEEGWTLSGSGFAVK